MNMQEDRNYEEFVTKAVRLGATYFGSSHQDRWPRTRLFTHAFNSEGLEIGYFSHLSYQVNACAAVWMDPLRVWSSAAKATLCQYPVALED